MKIPATILCFSVVCWGIVGGHSAALAQAGGGEAKKRAEAAKKSEPASKAEAPKIDGMEVARAGGGFLGVQIVGATFKISFYDAQKKPVAPDVARAALRWDPKYKVGKESVVLNLSEDQKSLSSPRNIRPPYQFKLFITLLKETSASEEAAGETLVIDFRG